MTQSLMDRDKYGLPSAGGEGLAVWKGNSWVVEKWDGSGKYISLCGSEVIMRLQFPEGAQNFVPEV